MHGRPRRAADEAGTLRDWLSETSDDEPFAVPVSPAALQAVTIDEGAVALLLPFLVAIKGSHSAEAAYLAKELVQSIPDEWHARPALQPLLSFSSSLR